MSLLWCNFCQVQTETTKDWVCVICKLSKGHPKEGARADKRSSLIEIILAILVVWNIILTVDLARLAPTRINVRQAEKAYRKLEKINKELEEKWGHIK